MTMLRQIRSTGPMRAPCFRGLSLGHFMLKVYWVLFCCVPGTLAAPCLTCYGFQPGCTFETNGKCPMADIPVANLAITPLTRGLAPNCVEADTACCFANEGGGE